MLAALLGFTSQLLRITYEVPRRISVIDLAKAITKKDANHAAQDVGYVKDRHPEVTEIFGDFKFCGQRPEKKIMSILGREARLEAVNY